MFELLSGGLLGSVFGGLFRLAPEILKFLDKKKEKRKNPDHQGNSVTNAGTFGWCREASWARLLRSPTYKDPCRRVAPHTKIGVRRSRLDYRNACSSDSQGHTARGVRHHRKGYSYASGHDRHRIL